MLDLLAQVRANPSAPGAALSGGLREARHLHSAERRLVGDGVREVLRYQAVLDHHTGTPDDETRWLAWLVSQGLPPETARQERPGVPFGALVDLGAASDAAIQGLEPVDAVRVRGSLHRALAEQLVTSLGPEGALSFVDASNGRAPIGLRLNPVRGTMDQARALLSDAGIEVEPMALAEQGLQVQGRANIAGNKAFRAGLVEVQDEGSQVLSSLVRPEQGPVVDFCAGAGGKTLAMASRAPHLRFLATDVRPKALHELRRRAERAGVPNLQVERLGGDGTLPDAVRAWSEQAERVLVDAPCSGTGTLRRRAEVRLRLDAKHLARMPVLQGQVLDNARALVRPGGRLIYGTCSVLTAENDDVVHAFLRRHADFRLVPLAEVVGGARAEAIGDGTFLRLAPHTHGTDGFFAAILERGTDGGPA